MTKEEEKVSVTAYTMSAMTLCSCSDLCPVKLPQPKMCACVRQCACKILIACALQNYCGRQQPQVTMCQIAGALGQAMSGQCVLLW